MAIVLCKRLRYVQESVCIVLRSDSNKQAETASVRCAAVSVFKIINASEPLLSSGKYGRKKRTTRKRKVGAEVCAGARKAKQHKSAADRKMIRAA